MIEELGGIGMPADAGPVEIDEQRNLANAVREYVEERTADIIEISGARSPDLIQCPSCGNRTILLDRPATYVVKNQDRLCAACGAERELVDMYLPDADIGGEGGA
jgi:DNA-directed RNA polymerase subunit RPC12/RpoP